MALMWGAGGLYIAALALLTVTIVRGWRRLNQNAGHNRLSSMLRTIFAIALNSLVANAWTLSHGGGEPWGLFFVLDALSAILILVKPAGKMQSVIGATFLVKLAFDTAYGLVYINGQPDQIMYWWELTIVGFTQLLLVGGWWLNDRASSRLSLRGDIGRDSAPNRAGVG